MESRGSFRLTVRQGPVPGKVFDLFKDVLTIGRDVTNDVVINDAEVSRNHARLTAQSGGYLMEDLASTNGTFVNGQRLIGPKLLNAGDVIGLGETVVLDYNYVADAGATVVAQMPQRLPAADATTATPRFEPPPDQPLPQTMAEPMMYAPGPQPPAAPEPPPMGMGAPAPLAAPKRDNRIWYYVGGGCDCLTLCACLGLLAYFVPWSDILAGFGLVIGF